MTAELFHFEPSAADCEPVVFLPGWGFPGRIAELVPCLAGLPLIYPLVSLPPSSLARELADFLERRNITGIIAVGWSMGANQALDFALKNPMMVAELHLLALRVSWPVPEIAAIRSALHENPESFLKNFYRKCFLGFPKEYKRFVKVIQERIIAGADLAVLDRGLDYLAAHKLPEHEIAGLDITVSHGEKDIIAPVSDLPRLPGRHRRIIPHRGHMFFLAADFALPCRRGKETVRRKFSRAAGSYDSYADVQKEVALRLAAMLPRTDFHKILEIGCGTGNYTSLLNDRYPGAEICALDFSGPMLDQARKKIQSSRVTFLCADGEDYLAEKNKFDLITSNGAFQWFARPHAAFVRIGDRLNEQGWFICSIFGPETFVELRKAFDDVLVGRIQPAAASFLPGEELKESLVRIFHQVQIDELRLKREYDSVLDLLRHLRKTGSSGFQPSGRPILNRRLLRELDKWFAERGGYHLTYQVFMCKIQT